MDLPVNAFKRRLTAGEQQIGLWSHLSSYISTEVIAGAGFDWIVLDAEHSPNDPLTILPQLQACTGGTASPVVRVPWNDTALIKRYLDVGAQTLLVPYVQDAEEAKSAVEAMRYPPRGVRGFTGLSRASRFGRVKDYFARAEKELCLIVQVETGEALGNLEAIAAVDGVDAVFIGPGDLSASLGHLGDPGHPDMQKIIVDTIKRIRACGKPAGILTGDETLARLYMSSGTTFTAVGADIALLARGAEALAARYKA
jgi:4-hydroxy-2-oxoheptanedioate aldolase